MKSPLGDAINHISPTDDVLVECLRCRGVYYLNGNDAGAENLGDVTLITGLITSKDARLRHALVAWMLVKPDAHKNVPVAYDLLGKEYGTWLRVLYSVAIQLQQIHSAVLSDFVQPWYRLPNYFPQESCAPRDPVIALQEVSDECARLYGSHINWTGTFNHIAASVIRRLTLQREWTRT